MVDKQRTVAFGATADPALFYVSEAHRRLLTRLWRLIDQAEGIGVVLGDYGSGKTSLLRKMAAHLAAAPERYRYALLPYVLPAWSSLDVLRAICQAFGVSVPEDAQHGALLAALHEDMVHHRDRTQVLLIDEAEYLTKRGQIEVLRLLQEIETPSGKLLNVICMGRLEWRQVLEAAPAFAQRAGLIVRMPELTLEESRGMLRFRMQQAAAAHGDTALLTFEPAALEALYAHSAGNPRRMVQLCRHLQAMYADQEDARVAPEAVEAVVQETTLAGLSGVARPLNETASAAGRGVAGHE